MKQFIFSLLLAAAFTQTMEAQNIPINAADRAILMEIYNNTGGPNWNNRANWGTNNYPWAGVYVDENGRVTGIDLGLNNLVGGPLPADLNQLTELRTFLVSRNYITGSIPSLTGLTNMQIFSAWNNNLTGSLPSFTGLPMLRVFDVSENQLSGSITSLAQLTNLKEFYVQNNQLTGSIPSLAGLNELVWFYAFNNQLTGSIPSLSDLPKLQYFYVNKNQLTGSIPNLSGLPKLQEFYVYKNKLSGSIPNLTNLPKLEKFLAYENQLTGNIPDLAGLPLLNNFIVNDNQLTGITPFVRPQSLWNFYIYNNNINFTAFDNITDPPLKTFLTTEDNFKTAPQTVPVTLAKTGNTISTNLAEGANPANYTYHWYKGTPGSGTLLTNVSGSNSITTTALADAGATAADNIYVTVTHNYYTVASDANKNIVLTSNALNTPLPVSFGSVTATIKGNQLMVNWQTLTENNNAYFEIEASKDGKEWKNIATLQSKAAGGNSSRPIDYNCSTPLANITLSFSLLAFALSLGAACKKAKTIRLLSFLLLAYALSIASCNKNTESTLTQKTDKLFVRIKQVDKDEKVQYSKVMTVVAE